MDTQENDRIRSQVRSAYAKVAGGVDGCAVGCCGPIIGQCMPGAEDYVASATVEGTKPGGASCCAPSCCA